MKTEGQGRGGELEAILEEVRAHLKEARRLEIQELGWSTSPNIPAAQQRVCRLVARAHRAHRAHRLSLQWILRTLQEGLEPAGNKRRKEIN